MTREKAKVDTADVASSLTPLMVMALLLKVLALKALAVLALLAPSVAKADRNTALDLDELTPSLSPQQNATQARHAQRFKHELPDVVVYGHHARRAHIQAHARRAHQHAS